MSVFSMAKSAMAALTMAIAFAMAAAPASAQVSGEARPYYDVAREVTVRGTVSRVLTTPEAGMIFGSHLLVQAGSGELDASLGRWAMQGKGSLKLAAGQQVELTGVMKTLMKRQVLIVRNVKVDGQVYTIRTQHGVELSPRARELAARQAAKGELQ